MSRELHPYLIRYTVLHMNTEQHRQAVAAEVRAQLGRKNMSKAELAKRTGLSPQSISRKLDGERAISVEELVLIAKALEVSASALLPAYTKQATAA